MPWEVIEELELDELAEIWAEYVEYAKARNEAQRRQLETVRRGQ